MPLLTHCPAAELHDLQEILGKIRDWLGVQEVKPGVYSIKGHPFLTIYRNETHRWANVRRGSLWGNPILLPFSMTEIEHKRVLREIKDRYLRTSYSLAHQVVA